MWALHMVALSVSYNRVGGKRGVDISDNMRENVTRDVHDKRGDLLLYIVNGEGLHYNCSYLVLIQ